MQGGTYGGGTMFKWDYTTFFTNEYSFNQTTGYYPTGSFIEVNCTPVSCSQVLLQATQPYVRTQTIHIVLLPYP